MLLLAVCCFDLDNRLVLSFRVVLGGRMHVVMTVDQRSGGPHRVHFLEVQLSRRPIY